MKMKLAAAASLAVFVCFTNGFAVAQTTPPVETAADPVARDPFCAVDVEAALTSPTALVAHLRADGASAGAHLVVFSATDAYAVDVPALALSGARSIKNTAPFEITFPKPIEAKFIYVDSYRLDGGAETACPTEPREFESKTPANPGGTPRAVASTLHLAAKFVQMLPPLTCGTVYNAATIQMAVSPDLPMSPEIVEGSVRVIVYVDAKGRATKAYVLSSSGSKYEENATKEGALKSGYTPASFYCAPVPGTYVYRMDFARMYPH
ncbi:MAG: energy transducer TonB [Candidatus Tumulicola sp.]